ncbi:hypothetical protein O0I10_004600 [Lichtheimia ornata]|uniref:GHMP kinase N-terminal domain-containing protein n=1 Tax=Lichtheimia ornata TaxID=688661 RepID=A0AAD7V8N7_9FUNG|nr:uncharacterized protein O0I10_004600 [Lichtheimia ornata]KAJ8659621.1 hypothetical protein O0I10_004600 [Lichtheimia ornata]
MDTLIILASASRPTCLESQIKNTYSTQCLQWHGLPKPLLPVSGKPALTWWLDEAKALFKNIYIVTNAHNYKNYERWATGHDFPKANILNCGFSTGPISDITFVHRVKDCRDGVSTIMMADFLYNDNDTWLPSLLKTSQEKTALYFYNGEQEKRMISLVLQPNALGALPSYVSNLDGWSVIDQEKELAMMISDHIIVDDKPAAARFMEEQLSFDEYLADWLDDAGTPCAMDPIHVKAYARVGLMGNPSDGFYGKTMSLLISNFWAEVALLPQPTTEITIMSNPVADPRRFSTIASLAAMCQEDGYDNGDRLLLACCKVFYTHCRDKGIELNTRQGFRVMFDTNIPRQVGLAGSSAIITAFWKALIQFYNVTTIPLEEQASLVLSVEQNELGIAAGLQDRVIQTYGGLVYMDFEKSYMEKHKHGKYEQLDLSLVPPLFLAYVAHPEDSGKVHSTVKQRFLANDPEIIDAMKTFASFTDKARKALYDHDHHEFAQLMTANFEQRRKTYGDDVVGAVNLRMVEIARQHRCVAKFPGSGGAVVGMWNGDNESTRIMDMLNLRHALEKEGYVFVNIIPKDSEP